MRRTILAVLAAAVLATGGTSRLSAAEPAAGAAEKSIMKLGKPLVVEDLGTPVRSRTMSNVYLFKMPQTGELHLTLCLEAYSGLQNDPPFQIYDLNMDTGQARIVTGMVGRPGPKATLFHSNGKLYIGTSRPCDLLEYDPATGKSRRIGRLDKDYYHGIQIAVEGPDGAIYFGAVGYVAGRYDPRTDKLENLGVMGSGGWRGVYGYVYTIGADSRFVYCGMGQQPWYLVIYDRQTGQQTSYFRPEKGAVNYGGTVIPAEDGKVYYRTSRAVYLLANGQPTQLATPPKIVPQRRGNVYEVAQAAEAGVELDTSDVRPTNWNNGEVIVRWRPLDAAQGAPNNVEGRKIGEKDWRSSAMQGADVQPSVPKRLVATPEGRLIGVTSFYGPWFAFDPDTKKSSFLGASLGDIQGVLLVGNKMYLSGYPSLFSVCDLAQPWTLSPARSYYAKDQNPFRVVLQPSGKYNPFLALGADGRIYSGQQHERGSVGGSFAWYDPRAGKSGGYREELLKHSVRDLIAINGGRTIVVSTVSIEKNLRGRLFIYDTEAGKITGTYEPMADGRDTGKLLDAGVDEVLGLVRTAPRAVEGGKVQHEGILYRFNTKTGALVYTKKIPGRVFSGYGEVDLRLQDAEFTKGPDGCGWLFIDDTLCRIHPEDGSVERALAMRQRGRLLFVGNDLYIYNGGREFFGGFSQILRVRNVVR